MGFSFLCIHCESHSVELTSDRFGSDDPSLNERIQKKNTEDQYLQKIYSSSQKMKEMLWIVKNAIYNQTNSSEFTENSTDYFPIEFINNLIHLFLDKIPQNFLEDSLPESKENYLRHGQFKIPTAALVNFTNFSEPCRTLDAALLMKKIEGEANFDIDLYIKACDRIPKYLPFLKISWTKNGFTANVIANFVDILNKETKVESSKLNCDIKFNDALSVIENFTCENLQIQFIKDQVLHFSSLKYTANADIQLQGKFEIYENNKYQDTGLLTILSNGSSKVEYLHSKEILSEAQKKIIIPAPTEKISADKL